MDRWKVFSLCFIHQRQPSSSSSWWRLPQFAFLHHPRQLVISSFSSIFFLAFQSTSFPPWVHSRLIPWHPNSFRFLLQWPKIWVYLQLRFSSFLRICWLVEPRNDQVWQQENTCLQRIWIIYPCPFRKLFRWRHCDREYRTWGYFPWSSRLWRGLFLLPKFRR